MVSSYSPNDGYTENGYIREVRNLLPALRFTFRPFTQDQRSKMLSENMKLDHHKASRNTAGVVAAKIVSWDMKDGNGNEVKPSPEILGRLKPYMYDRLTSIVMGLEPSDDDPDATVKEKEKSLAEELASINDDKVIGESVGEADLKN